MILYDMQFQVIIEDLVYPTLLTELDAVREYAHDLASDLGAEPEEVQFQWRCHVTASTEWVDVGGFPDWEALFAEVAHWSLPTHLRESDQVAKCDLVEGDSVE